LAYQTPFQVIATRAAKMASLVNADNYVVAASQDTVTAALGDGFEVNSSSEMAFLPHLFGTLSDNVTTTRIRLIDIYWWCG
jgi:hypothetical protein